MKKDKLYRKKYLYINGKAIVETTQNKKKVFQFNEVLEKRLSQENLVKKILDALIEWQDDKDEKKTYHKYFISIFIAIVGIGMFSFRLWSGYSIGVSGIIGLLLGGTAIVSSIKEIIKQNKEIKRKNKVVIPYLEEKLEEESQKLEELKNKEKNLNETEVKNQPQEISVRKIPSNQETIGKINRDINMYGEMDANSKKYILYFELGILKQKLLEMKYSEEEMDKIEKCISAEATYKAESQPYTLTMNLIKNVRKFRERRK